jgi:hypothetical protein
MLIESWNMRLQSLVMEASVWRWCGGVVVIEANCRCLCEEEGVVNFP